MKEITKYVAIDGCVFDTEQEVAHYELHEMNMGENVRGWCFRDDGTLRELNRDDYDSLQDFFEDIGENAAMVHIDSVSDIECYEELTGWHFDSVGDYIYNDANDAWELKEIYLNSLRTKVAMIENVLQN